MKQTILIIEDDQALNNGIKISLQGPELELLQAFDLAQAGKSSGAMPIL